MTPPKKAVQKAMKTANEINPVDVHRIIEMAWEDRTPFDAIEHQFGIPEKENIRLMRSNLKPSSFRLWRKRVNEGVSLKHREKRNPEINRFKSRMQK
jgi:uncharacterized protein (TIGR03643 family)